MGEEVTKLLEQPLPHPTKRNWHWLVIQFMLRMVFPVYFRFRTRGVDRIAKEGGGLVLLNHQSSLDPLLAAMPLHRPLSFVARDTLFSVPIVGWVLRNTYVLPLNRKAASSRLIKQMAARMEHGFLVGMFPEGTRTEDGEVQEFKPGFIAMIRRCTAPIYPAGIAGAYEAMPRGAVLPRPRRVRLIFGDPIPRSEIDRLLKDGREADLVTLVRKRVIECQAEAEQWQNPRNPKAPTRNPVDGAARDV